jgi:hypothetical protein
MGKAGRHPSQGSPHFARLAPIGTETISWVGAESNATSSLPSTGIRSTIKVVSGVGVLPSDPAPLFAAWNAMPEFSNNVWAQTGYFSTEDSTYGFYQIWDLASETIETTGEWPITDFADHTFTIQYSGTGTVWDFLMDGVLQGSYDLGVSSATSINSNQPFEALVEKQVWAGDAAWTVPTIGFSAAFSSYKAGTWKAVTAATAYSSSNSSYGVQGHDQNPSLSANAINVGNTIPEIDGGTVLWSAVTPVLPALDLTLSTTVNSPAAVKTA